MQIRKQVRKLKKREQQPPAPRIRINPVIMDEDDLIRYEVERAKKGQR